ncbi:Clavaminate synthase-like protein [Gigaspora margarita]|uniref:Clavaminate synthase-like protein n=1 Tax=Gigaspora margarita TaxID=4874 RepID=A0A8H4A5N3_GIGMA|nr:Clavaminate synthase-like protein [Gigaspora margarita]
MEFQPIDLPIIDFSPLEDNNLDQSKELKKIANNIDVACKRFGVFYVTTSSFQLHDQNHIFESSRQFFSLPEEKKNTIPIKSGGFTRGYIGLGNESGSHRFEVKEAFSYGYEWDPNEQPTNSLQGRNEWGNLQKILGEQWRNTLNKYYDKMVAISELVVKSLEIALGVELKSHCVGGETISIMRLFKYYPYNNEISAGSDKSENIGSSPHTDWGFLTLVLQQENIQGLQLFYDSQWWDIPSKPATIVVNCGDYLSLLTRGQYISPLHRVISDGTNERYSTVFFYYPAYESKIPMIAQCSNELSIFKDQTDKSDTHDENDKEKLLDVCFGEYITRKWDQVFRSGKPY